MKNEELNAFLEKLEVYYQHLRKNKDSLIAKIYGVYTFSSKDSKQHLFLMRNIASCPKEFIIRTYDLKGSTYDREVL